MRKALHGILIFFFIALAAVFALSALSGGERGALSRPDTAAEPAEAVFENAGLTLRVPAEFADKVTVETEEERLWLEKQNFANTAKDAYTG